MNAYHKKGDLGSNRGRIIFPERWIWARWDRIKGLRIYAIRVRHLKLVGLIKPP